MTYLERGQNSHSNLSRDVSSEQKDGPLIFIKSYFSKLTLFTVVFSFVSLNRPIQKKGLLWFILVASIYSQVN